MKETPSTYFASAGLTGSILLANLDITNLLEAGLKSAIGTLVYVIGRILYDRYQGRQQKVDDKKPEEPKRTGYTVRKNKKENK